MVLIIKRTTSLNVAWKMQLFQKKYPLAPFLFLYPWSSKSLAVSEFFHSANTLPLAKRMLFTMSMMLEVLAHTEEVTCEVVVQYKVIHLRLHLCGGKPCVIDKSAAIADFGIEHLASAHCFVRLDEVNDIVRHLIVASPRVVLHPVVDDDWCDVVLLIEDFGSLGGESCGFVGARDVMN